MQSDDTGRATQRAKAVAARAPKAISARYDRRLDRVIVHLNSNLDIAFSPKDAEGLEHAKPSQLEMIEITPSGFGIYFPKLDADLYLPALLEGFLGSRKWMARRLGRLEENREAKRKTGGEKQWQAGWKTIENGGWAKPIVDPTGKGESF